MLLKFDNPGARRPGRGLPMISTFSTRRRALLAGVSLTAALGASLAATGARAIVVNNTLNPNAAPTLQTGVNGVGQMNIPIYNAQGVFTSFSTCTGTLINPRTVIFAAHCVNGRPMSAYGAATGGQPLGFLFNADNLAPAVAGQASNNPANNYINGQFIAGSASRGPRNRTSVAQNVFNASQVFYDPRSLQEPQGNFLEADIAMATLDTPAKAIPTWTLLFSPLTASTHVTITGYGRSGTGTTGDTAGVDFRRRAAENILASLISLDDEDRALFGGSDPNAPLPQDVYFIDFDDPARGTPQRSRFDFDVHRDAALPREGSTAGGDSGGPLIVDQRFSQPVIAGVLSGGGGYSAEQPNSSYGERSFYQPLFLFWDVIVANNPYRYVSANPGDGDWFDATRWTQQMDPAYAVLENGQLRNGLPTTPALGVSGATPSFGTICNGSRCTTFTPSGSFIAQDDEKLDQNDAPLADTASAAEYDGRSDVSGRGEPSVEAAPAPPAATTPGLRIAGGPGSTGFTPNNVDGNRLTGARANYYEVALSNAGVTSLGANANAALRSATIDRLSISNAGARLNITAGGALTALMDASLFSGTLHVDGRLVTPELFLMAGMLSGSGTVQTDFLTNVMGAIAPGGVGAVGAMTVAGDVVLSSGSQLLIDLAARPSAVIPPALGPASNDLLRTTAGAGTSGNINLGGLLSLNVLPGFRPVFGDTYVVVSATAPAARVTGAFSAVNDFVGVLRPELSYSSNAVQVRVGAASFLTLTDPASGVQTGFGRMLDSARTDPAALAALRPLFDELDVLEGAPLRASLESLAPYATVTTGNLVRAHLEGFDELLSGRTQAAREGRGGVSLIGRPMALLAARDGLAPVQGAEAAADAVSRPLAVDTAEGVTAFIAGGVLSGEAAPLSNTVFGGRETLDSLYVAGGVERALFPGAVIGAAAGYTRGEGEYQGQLSQVDVSQVQFGVYGGVQGSGGLFVDAHASLGWFKAETARSPQAGAVRFQTRDENHGSTGAIGLGAGYNIRRSVVTVTPLASLSYQAFRSGAAMESADTSSSAALGLTIRARRFEQAVARAGVKVSGDLQSGGLRVRPSLKLAVAGDLIGEEGEAVSATLTASPATFTDFATGPRDDSWYELGAGLTVEGERVGLHLGYTADVKREDLETRRFTAALSYRF